MTTKTVVVEVATKPQAFPLGTVEGLFHFQIAALDGTILSEVDTPIPGASFPLVPAGTYVALVSKNGVVLTKEFTIEATEETFQVPDVITVTFS